MYRSGDTGSVTELAIDEPMIYTAERNIFDASISNTRASGRGLGPGNRDFFGPCERQRTKRVPFGPKKSRENVRGATVNKAGSKIPT
jgi:hypothetical protein